MIRMPLIPRDHLASRIPARRPETLGRLGHWFVDTLLKKYQHHVACARALLHYLRLFRNADVPSLGPLCSCNFDFLIMVNSRIFAPLSGTGEETILQQPWGKAPNAHASSLCARVGSTVSVPNRHELRYHITLLGTPSAPRSSGRERVELGKSISTSRSFTTSQAFWATIVSSGIQLERMERRIWKPVTNKTGVHGLKDTVDEASWYKATGSSFPYHQSAQDRVVLSAERMKVLQSLKAAITEVVESIRRAPVAPGQKRRNLPLRESAHDETLIAGSAYGPRFTPSHALPIRKIAHTPVSFARRRPLSTLKIHRLSQGLQKEILPTLRVAPSISSRGITPEEAKPSNYLFTKAVLADGKRSLVQVTYPPMGSHALTAGRRETSEKIVEKIHPETTLGRTTTANETSRFYKTQFKTPMHAASVQFARDFPQKPSGAAWAPASRDWQQGPHMTHVSQNPSRISKESVGRAGGTKGATSVQAFSRHAKFVGPASVPVPKINVQDLANRVYGLIEDRVRRERQRRGR